MTLSPGWVISSFVCYSASFGIFGLTVGKGGLLSEVMMFFVPRRSSWLVIYLEALIYAYQITLSPRWVISSFVCCIMASQFWHMCFNCRKRGGFFRKFWCFSYGQEVPVQNLISTYALINR